MRARPRHTNRCHPRPTPSPVSSFVVATMGLFTSSISSEERDRIRRACTQKATALVQCEKINGVAACVRLSSDYDYCRASRVNACAANADAFEKCTRRVVQHTGAPEDVPTCEKELKAMRKCLRGRGA
jgi:hypothetical protein